MNYYYTECIFLLLIVLFLVKIKYVRIMLYCLIACLIAETFVIV